MESTRPPSAARDPVEIASGRAPARARLAGKTAILLLALLAPPAGAQEPLELPPGQAGAVVPARRGGNLLFVPLQIDGKDAGWFIVDTGATHITLDTGVADKLELKITGHAKAAGIAGTQKLTFRRVETVRLGPATLRAAAAVATDLSGFSREAGRPVAGLLGYDAWRHLPVTLDYQAHTITFHDRTAFRAPAGAAAIRLRVANRRPTVRAVIEGKYFGQVLLDTGHEGRVNLHARYLARFPALAAGRRFAGGTSVGVGGQIRSRYAPLATMEILGRTFTDVRAEFPEFKPNPNSLAPHMAVLGGTYLSQFRLTLDYRLGLAWAQPPSPPPATGPARAEQDFLGLSALHRAVRAGEAALLTRELRPGAKTDLRDLRGRTALATAAELGRDDMVRALLAAKADPDLADKKGRTPLLIAASADLARIAKDLLSAGARPDLRDAAAQTALLAATAKGHQATVAALLDGRADPNADDAKGRTALILAAEAKHAGIAALLLAAGANVNAKTSLGASALAAAAAAGDDPLVRMLLEHRANVNSADLRRFTPLTLAAYYNHTAASLRLLAAGADPNRKTLLGQTALMFAAQHGNLQLATELLRRGADPAARAPNGDTPLSLARKHRHAFVARALVQAGAKN